MFVIMLESGLTYVLLSFEYLKVSLKAFADWLTLEYLELEWYPNIKLEPWKPI